MQYVCQNALLLSKCFRHAKINFAGKYTINYLNNRTKGIMGGLNGTKGTMRGSDTMGGSNGTKRIIRGSDTMEGSNGMKRIIRGSDGTKETME
jgi:hypothetical protein